LPYVRATLAESLRLYPQPPILIRRALAPDTLPPGLNGAADGYPIGAGERQGERGRVLFAVPASSSSPRQHHAVCPPKQIAP
jgi:hypothetical protein